MRVLKIQKNNIWYDLDIDDNTAIGIDIQSFDIKEPSLRKLNVSNEFNIPKTQNNCLLFGLIGDSQKVIYDSGTIYSSLYVKMKIEYYLNHQTVIRGYTYITSVDENRINMYITPEKSVFDALKEISWEQFEDLYLDYLHIVYDEIIEENKVTVTDITDFTNRFSYNGESKLRFLPQFTDIDVLNYNDVATNYYPEFKYENLGNPLYQLLIDDDWNIFYGAKFGTRFTEILKFLEWYMSELNLSFKYDINNEKIINLGIPLKHIYINFYENYDPKYYEFYLSSSHLFKDYYGLSTPINFLKTNTSEYYKGLTMLDYIKSACQMLGLVITDISEGGSTILEFSNILETKYKSIDDKNFTGGYKLKPIVDGYKYLNFIGCEGFEDSPFRIYNSNTSQWIENMRGNYWVYNAFLSLNENLEKGYNENYIQNNASENPFDYDALNHIFKINSWQPITYENWSLDREKSKSLAFWHENANNTFNHFLFGEHINNGGVFIYQKLSTSIVTVMFASSIIGNGGPAVSQFYCDITCEKITGFNHYQSSTFRNLAIEPIEKLVKVPQVYTVKKYLQNYEFSNDFRINNIVYIKHLNGVFFANKISGYNPESTEATEIELIKITE